MFAFAIWDSHKNELTLARDRAGEKPLVYARGRHSLVFSSELRGLLPILREFPNLNALAIRRFFQFQYIPEPDTAFEGIYKLPPGHYLTFSQAAPEQEPVAYWSLSKAGTGVQVSNDRSRAIQQVRETLDSAVASTLEADVPIAVALSGGMDSSAIAAIAAARYRGELTAYAVGYPGRPPYDERDQACSLAKSLGIEVTELEIPIAKFTEDFAGFVGTLTDPIADPAAYAHMAVPAAMGADDKKVLLSGIGGDELFWGYPWVVRAVKANEEKRSGGLGADLAATARFLRERGSPAGGPKDLARILPLALSHFRANHTPRGRFRFFEESPQFADDLLAFRLLGGKNIRGLHKRELLLSSEPWPADKSQVCRSNERVIQAVFKTWLASNALALGDSVSMKFGVETRMPFLEPNLIETVIGVQRKFPDFSNGHKTLLREALSSILPSEVLLRPKAGFRPPVSEWLSSAARANIDCLRGESLDRAGMININRAERLLQGAAPRPPSSQLFLLYKMVLIQIWLASIENDWRSTRG